jgi:hypothetical protein
MNAAVEITFSEPMDLVGVTSAPEQRRLLTELAGARTKRAALTQELRTTQTELEVLAPQRQRHQFATDACTSLEKLAEAGGATLFWGTGTSPEKGAEHVRSVRGRIEAFGDWLHHMEERQADLHEQIRRQSDLIDAIEHALFEAQDEEEQRQYEWEIEREISEPRRKFVMPWTRGGEEDRRFRKSIATALLLSMLFSAILTQVNLPAQIASDGTRVPERVVRLLMEERPTPPPPPLQEIPKPKLPEKLAEQKPVEKPVPPQRLARVEEKLPEEVVPPEPQAQGILAFREKLASAKEDQVVGRLGLHAQIDNADYNSAGRTERSMLTTSAPGSSGGINLASLSRGVGNGNGSGPGGGMAGVKVTNASSSIAAVGAPGGDRPLSGDSASAGRTDEEIQIVFDRYKAALYRLYNKELRKDPTLRGQVVLRLTIEPDGSVSICELTSTDMNAPELTAQVVERVKGFDFGVKAVPAITILYPIDFLPAA